MTYVTPRRANAANAASWPDIPQGMSGAQIVAIARMVERVCGTEAAAGYLASAIASYASAPVAQPTSRTSQRGTGPRLREPSRVR